MDKFKIATNFKGVNCKKEEEERVGFVSYQYIKTSQQPYRSMLSLGEPSSNPPPPMLEVMNYNFFLKLINYRLCLSFENLIFIYNDNY